MPKAPDLGRNKYYSLNWIAISRYFNTSCPHRVDTLCISPQHHLSAVTTQNQARTSSSLSDQARLTNPSPGIVALLPSAALEHHCSPDFFSTRHPWSNEARPRKASGVGTNLKLCLRHNFKARVALGLAQHYARICKPTY